MYKPLFQKVDECECGERLSIKQKRCPRCKSPNLDFEPRSWVGGIKEEKEENESAGPYVNNSRAI